MSDPSNASKQRWNALNYTQVKISVRPELAAAFKSACAEAGASMASVLAGFMASYSQFPAKRDPLVDPYVTRKQRRRAVDALISQMESLALVEESYRDNIPENLRGSIRYKDADRSVGVAYEAIDRLREIY